MLCRDEKGRKEERRKGGVRRKEKGRERKKESKEKKGEGEIELTEIKTSNIKDKEYTGWI